MTLARRILFRNVALLTGLAALAGVALAGLVRLSGNIYTLSTEYAELRLVDRVTRHVITAQAALSHAPAERERVGEALGSAVAEMDRFVAEQLENVEGSAAHEASENDAIHAARRELQAVIHDLSAAPGPTDDTAPARASPLEHVNEALSKLNRVMRDADELVARTRRRAERSVLEALVAIVAGFLVIAVVSVIISRSQYRDIMLPLRRLRDGARRMAAGHFDEPVPAGGDREFAELAGDFNRMGAELRDLYGTLEQKVEQKSRELVRSERLASVGFLAAGVAHEINNPLGIMAGYAQLTLKRLHKGVDAASLADVRRTLEIIRDESFRCRQITEKLLSLSVPGRGERVPVRLADVAEAVAVIVGAHERYRRRRVTAAVADADSLVACADEAEMKQVLLNLVINALESVEDDTGRVWIEGSRENGTVRLFVCDNGCGMSPEVREHIFEPFFTARRPGATGAPSHDGDGRAHGAGLGLTIAHAIVEAHGGRIWAESAGAGRGSRFVVELPAATGTGAHAAAAPPGPNGKAVER